jgi:23S rRNA pseudouridine2605 synthase
MISKTSPTIKLQKYIAQMTGLSRRAAEKQIEKKQVKVNDQPAHIGQRVTPGKDQVELAGKNLTPDKELCYLLLHKPPGVVTTRSDELDRPTVMSLLPKEYQHLFPVGRLDLESEGLLLITNDGQLAQVLTHPKFKIEKTYQVQPDRKVTSPAFSHLKRGMQIDRKKIKPIDIHRMPENWLSITITSGQKHVVRKMMEKSGYNTLRLVRTQFGPLELGELKKGEWRELDSVEIKSLQ